MTEAAAESGLILAFDTSLPTLSIALVEGDATLGVLMLRGEGSRNEKLLPGVDFLLEQAGRDRREIELIAVTRGPGSFTGVRIGLATAHGLGFALGRRVLGFSTHQAVVVGDQRTLVVFNDAGRGELYLTAFRDGETEAGPMLVDESRLEHYLGQYGKGIDVLRLAERQPVALSAALRASELSAAGTLDPWLDTSPIYVRKSAAEE